MAFVDPPYNVALGDHGGQQRGQRRRRIQNDTLPADEWESFVRRWARNLLSSVDGAIYVCMSSKEWPLVSRVLEEEGAHWSDTIIWAKDRFVLGRADYQRQYEPIWYGWREGVQHFWKGENIYLAPLPPGQEVVRPNDGWQAKHPNMPVVVLTSRFTAGQRASSPWAAAM